MIIWASLLAVALAGVAMTVVMPFAVLGAIEASGASVTELALLGGVTAEAIAGAAGAGAAAIGARMVGTAAAGLVTTTSSSGPSTSDEEEEDGVSKGNTNDKNGIDESRVADPTILRPGDYDNDVTLQPQRPISAWRSWV